MSVALPSQMFVVEAERQTRSPSREGELLRAQHTTAPVTTKYRLAGKARPSSALRANPYSEGTDRIGRLPLPTCV